MGTYDHAQPTLRSLGRGFVGLVRGVAVGACTTGGGDPGVGGAGGASGSGIGPACGSVHCAGDRICVTNNYWCVETPPVGAIDIGSGCEARPAGCAHEGPPACGCDGVVYEDQCAANEAGTDIGAGACSTDATPVALFPCGPFFCDAGTSYGYDGEGDTGDRYFFCHPLPATCGALPAPACSCLPLEPGDTCGSVQGNGFTGLTVTRILA
jgi:hypothetical protein